MSRLRTNIRLHCNHHVASSLVAASTIMSLLCVTGEASAQSQSAQAFKIATQARRVNVQQKKAIAALSQTTVTQQSRTDGLYNSLVDVQARINSGAVGATGPQGPKGDKGDAGIAGAQGPKGDKGDIGLRGVDGPQGPKGDKGDKGDPGADGATGATGATGQTGAKGDPGQNFTTVYQSDMCIATVANDSVVACNIGVHRFCAISHASHDRGGCFFVTVPPTVPDQWVLGAVKFTGSEGQANTVCRAVCFD